MMNLPYHETRILLIGRGLRSIDKLIGTFDMISAELFFADDANEGLRLMSSKDPDVVICEMQLPDLSAAELCMAIRSNVRLSRIPLVFAGGAHEGLNAAFNTLHAGADDLFTEYFNPDHFLAKLVWVMEQRNTETARKQEFAMLKAKQLQTLDIVKETSELFRALASDDSLTETGGDPMLDRRIELGMSMITGLAGIMEEQMRTIEGWFEHGSTQRSWMLAQAAEEQRCSVTSYNDLGLHM